MMDIHGKDGRKGTPIPYVAHLLGVCALVLADGGDEDEAVAALLHDTLEDHPERLTRKDIEDRFGPRVRELVELCTDTSREYAGGPKAPWWQRKLAYIEQLARAGPSALRVPLADKVDNLRAILADYRRLGDDLWSRFNAGKTEQLWFYASLVTAFQQAGMAGPMFDEFGRLVGELEQLAAGAK
ncbi:MAG: HD domain-containing protein [Acidobacteria bacterium]|nr:HD domain-containing protein [Acidobacteriota bacterium]